MPMSPAVREREPIIRQIFIGRGPEVMVTDALERKLYVIRRRAANAIRCLGLEHGKEFYQPSMSARTIVYKGLLLADQVGEYYVDLKDPRCVSALALVLMPNCPKLLAFAPLAMGAFILLFMDLSFNVTMQPFRALVADMLDDSQKTQGYVVQTFLINLGAVVGAILPLVMTWLGVSDEAAPGHVSPHIAYSYYAGGAILLLTVLVTSFKTREYPPGEFARYNNLSEEDAKPVSFVGLMRNVPGVMVRLGVTQFFSWAALFLMWTYLKPAITGVVTDHATGEVLSAGATQTWVGVLNGTYPIPACIAALFLGRVAARYGNKPVYAACLLAGALGFAGLCLLHDQYALMLPMVGIGIAWAGILAMPYAILSRAVEPRRMGVYMGIFNFTITVPQIVIGLTGGAIVKYCFASDAADMLALAGVFMLLAAVSVFLVK
jgi:maltose/moltooligosaccharide transporter